MGQYWFPVNLDKKEYINPHKLGSGLKLWEQLAASPGVGAALVILCAAMPEARGGGDLDLDENWHGPERTFPEYNVSPGPMPEEYQAIAKRTIGRWAGNRIALVGDYAKDTDLFDGHSEMYGTVPASQIYELCHEEAPAPGHWTDISEDVCRVIEHELQGKFTGDGWRTFERAK